MKLYEQTRYVYKLIYWFLTLLTSVHMVNNIKQSVMGYILHVKVKLHHLTI